MTVSGNSMTTTFYGFYSHAETNSNLLVARNGMTIISGGLAVDADDVKVTVQDVSILEGNLQASDVSDTRPTVNVNAIAPAFVGSALLLQSTTASTNPSDFKYETMFLPVPVVWLTPFTCLCQLYHCERCWG
jgi:hypothetical protein